MILMADVTDAEGKVTDDFTPKVKFNDVDEQQKPIILDLSVPEAIKRMKEIAKYGHLFKSTAKGGLGGNTDTSVSGKVDTSKLSYEQYQAYRKKQGLGRGKV